MVRTQIQLTEAQADGLRRIAAQRGVSLASVIRESVDRTLEQDDRAVLWERAFAVIGKYRDKDGATDVAERHDDYLADAYQDW
jgi:Ribbon-helix-helix protein, copG family